MNPKFTFGHPSNFSFRKLIILSILLLSGLPLLADNFVSGVSFGYWDDQKSWRQNGKKATRTPNGQDDVLIATGTSILIQHNEACASLTIGNGANSANLIITSQVTLAVTGAITVNNPDNATNMQHSNNLSIGIGTVQAQSMHIKADNGGPAPTAYVSVSSGSLYLTNDLSYVGGAKAKFELGNQGYLEIGGDLGAGTGGDFRFNQNSTVNYKGSTTQQWLRTAYAFGNIITNNLLGVKPDGPVTAAVILGDLTVETGLFHNNGFEIQGAPGKLLAVKDNATLTLTGTTGFPTGFGTTVLENNSTIVYGGGAQAVAGRSYGKLRLEPEAPAITAPKTLSGNAAVVTELQFNNAKLVTSANTFTIEDQATISGASATGYLVQSTHSKLIVKNLGSTGTGRSTSFLFPVGTAASYTPAFLTNHGPSNSFSVNVQDGINDKYHRPILNRVVLKTWNINQETNTGTANLEMHLQWNAADEASDFKRSSCGISHFENGEWQQPTNFGEAGPNASGAFAAGLSDVRSFSPFGVGDFQSALPVELVFFKAIKKGSHALLQWEIATEKNNTGFEVQASADGRKFERIGFVATGNGNANYHQRYEFTDALAGREGLWYYRLKQIDTDGTVAFFNAKVLDFGKLSESFTAFPNPFTDIINLNIKAATAAEAVILITDVAGKTVWTATQKLEKGENKLQLMPEQSLPAGVYLVTTVANGQASRLRLVKQ